MEVCVNDPQGIVECLELYKHPNEEGHAYRKALSVERPRPQNIDGGAAIAHLPSIGTILGAYRLHSHRSNLRLK